MTNDHGAVEDDAATSPLVLIVDDEQEQIPRGLRSAGYRGKRFGSITELRTYLCNVAPDSDPPLAALVDVSLDIRQAPNDWGLGAVMALRSSRATRRTGIILRTGFAVENGQLKEAGHTDLHAVFCAAACGDVGVLVAGKEKDEPHVVTAVHSMRQVLRSKPQAGFADLQRAGTTGGLGVIRPMELLYGERTTVDVVEVLLGNLPKRLLWQQLLEARHLMRTGRLNEHSVLEAALRSVYDCTVKLAPSRNLDTLGEKNGRLGRSYASREFVQGRIGKLAQSWRFWDGFLSDRRLMAEPDENKRWRMTVPDGVEAPGTCFDFFATTYERFLGHPDTVAFGKWYMSTKSGRT